MKIPVILTASSGSQLARSTYHTLEGHIRDTLQADHGNQYELHWGYSSRVINRECAKHGTSSLPAIQDVTGQLVAKGHNTAILQSLHLIVGHEFHQLHRESMQTAGLGCQMGKPLLTAPADFSEFMGLLAGIAAPYPEHALLLIGHGTRHASWPIYLGLEQVMQRHFGKRAYVGVVEHYPDTDSLEQRIVADGHGQVLVIPFFLIGGLHVQRDVLGDSESSWRNRLVKAGLEVAVALGQGLGTLPDVGQIYARHILEAAREIG